MGELRINTTVTSRNEHKLHRNLRARHLNMIAIGGAIGTGLFLASGASISTAGPGGALVAYSVIGIMVYFLMTSLGEMATFMPISGSFETYSTHFFDSALGFALGWNYWYNWALTVAVELSASALVIKFWFPNIPGFVWSICFLILLFTLNIMSTRIYGESEYWFTSIKVITIIVFLAIGILIILGILKSGSPTFSNWTIGEAPFVGGIAAIVNIFMIAGFSFQGTELVGLAAGESENPEVDVPKAINTVFWRILLFYIGAIIIIGFLIPYTDPNLLKTGVENIAVSPFTIVFLRAGFAFSASIMNAIILTSILSCGNSGLYAASRMLHALAVNKKAPSFIANVNKRGVPINALLITTIVSMFCFLSSLFGDSIIYSWLVNASGLAGLIAWIGIAFCHYRFRKAYIAQGKRLEDLKYKAKWYPFGPILAIILCMVVILGQNYQAFFNHTFSWYGIFVTYISLFIFILLYFGYKLIKKTKIISPLEANLDIEE